MKVIKVQHLFLEAIIWLEALYTFEMQQQLQL